MMSMRSTLTSGTRLQYDLDLARAIAVDDATRFLGEAARTDDDGDVSPGIRVGHVDLESAVRSGERLMFGSRRRFDDDGRAGHDAAARILDDAGHRPAHGEHQGEEPGNHDEPPPMANATSAASSPLPVATTTN